MTTINPYYTFKYAQPSEYQYSHDSVFLARLAYEYVVKNKSDITKVLDLCAGCGIVGMDFLFHLQKNKIQLPLVSDFLEIQDLYEPYFIENLKVLNEKLNRDLSSDFINLNYAAVTDYPVLSEKYNFIFSNPPFFHKGHGTLSHSEFKNRCRYFLDSDLKGLISAIQYLLSPGGTALVLIKDLKQHGIDIYNQLLESTNGLTFQKIDTLRGTDLFELVKPLVIIKK